MFCTLRRLCHYGSHRFPVAGRSVGQCHFLDCVCCCFSIISFWYQLFQFVRSLFSCWSWDICLCGVSTNIMIDCFSMSNLSHYPLVGPIHIHYVFLMLWQCSSTDTTYAAFRVKFLVGGLENYLNLGQTIIYYYKVYGIDMYISHKSSHKICS